MQEQVIKTYKIVLYGAGGYFSDREAEILSLPNTCMVGIADSSDDKIDKILAGFRIMNKRKLSSLHYDYIVITSTFAAEIKQELINIGVNSSKILNYSEYKTLILEPEIKHYRGDSAIENSVDSVLIITRHLDFSGSSIAAYYAAIALNNRNISVSIAAPSYDKPFLDYLVNNNIDVWIVDNLECGGNRKFTFMKKYNHIIINTYVMHQCVRYFDPNVDIIMWLHEAKSVYTNEAKYWGTVNELLANVRVYGVSEAAVDNFKSYYPEMTPAILEYGIPNVALQKNKEKTKSKRIVLAVIGAIYELKGQEILLDAVEKLDDLVNSKCEFWIIGKISESKYCKKVIKRCQYLDNVRVIGELSHDELLNQYGDIDVMISTSLEDMLPIVIVEGMMLGKKCIIPKDIGLSKYVNDGREVVKYETGNSSDLCVKITDLINNFNDLTMMGNYAKDFYQKCFSMESFSERLIQALNSK